MINKIQSIIISIIIISVFSVNLSSINVYAEDVNAEIDTESTNNSGNTVNKNDDVKTDVVSPKKVQIFGTFKDVSTDKPYFKPVEVLLALNLLKVSNDGMFKPNATTTRAEFTAMLVRILGINTVSDKKGFKGIFKDVPSSYWASTEIEIAYGLNLVNGSSEGRFAPESPIKGEDAIKMIVSTLGYADKSMANGGYPLGFIYVANDLKLLRNSEILSGNNLKRSDLACLIYNALSVELMSQKSFGKDITYTKTKGETLLSERLKIKKKTGQVTGSPFTRLTSDKGVNSDEIEIDGVIYKAGKTNTNVFLGCMVEYYTTIDKDPDKVIYVEIKDIENIIDIKADDIDNSTTKDVVKYRLNEDDAKTEEAVIYSNPQIIYNNKAYEFSKMNDGDLIPQIGGLRLIDINNDDKYEIILINSYENCVVDNVFSSSISFKDTYTFEGDNFIKLDDNDDTYKFYILKDNKVINLKDIKQNDVVSIAKSKNDGEKMIYIVNSRTSIKGIINEIGTDYILVGDKKYKPSSSFQSQTSKIGQSGIFYLDFEGKIAGSDFSQGKKIRYGYMTKSTVSQNGVDEISFIRVFTSAKTFVSLQFADYVKFNDETANSLGQRWTAKMVAESSLVKGKLQLVSYQLDSSGKINVFNTAEDMTNVVGYDGYDDDKFSLDYVTPEGVSLRYYYNELSALFLTTDAIIFSIPTNTNNEDNFDIISQFYNGNYYKNLKMYDSTIDSKPKVIVMEGVTTSNSNSFSGSFQMVDRVVSTVDKEGTGGYKVVTESSSGSKSYITQNNDVSQSVSVKFKGIDYSGTNVQGLKKGDIIKTSTDSKGKLIGFKILARADVALNATSGEESIDGIAIAPGATIHDYNYCVFGSVKYINSTMLKVDVGNNIARIIPVSDRVPVIIYSSTVQDGAIKKGTLKDVGLGSKVFINFGASRYTTVIYMYE